MAMSDPARAEDFYRSQFELKVSGAGLGARVLHDVMEVSYFDDLEELDGFAITVNNWDPQERRLLYSDSDQWLPGKEVEIAMGYRDSEPLRPMIKGRISSVTSLFPAEDRPQLKVQGSNLLVELMRKQESRVYEDKTDSQIAKEIAQQLGLEIRTAVSGPEPQYPYEIQVNSYDIVFLFERARRLGYELMVEDAGRGRFRLYFGPSRNLRRESYTLTYGRDLVEFHATLDIADQVSRVTVRGWDALNKEKIEGQAQRSDADCRGSALARLEQPFERAFKDREEIVVDEPIDNKPEADALAKGTMERIVQRLVTGHGRSFGLPELRAGATVEMKNLGQRYTGRWFVTATRHTIGDDGYHTAFWCRREDS